VNHRSINRARFAVAILTLLTIAGCSEQTNSPAGSVVRATSITTDAPPAELRAGSGQFAPPVLLTTDEGPVRVESPGYASPCWADIDNDGNKDLLVGQFNGGKIRVYKNLGEQKLATGEWLQAEGSVAQVPGVW